MNRHSRRNSGRINFCADLDAIRVRNDNAAADKFGNRVAGSPRLSSRSADG
jgi:hypothetical protein